MAPVQRTPPAKSPESQFTTLQRSSSEVDIGRWPTLAQIKHARRGRDERSTRASSLSSWSVSEIKHKPREADTGGLVSETVVKDVQRKRSVPKAPHGHVAVPQQSPTRSVFEDNGEEWGYALELPNDILKYLESRNWEAFYVPPDGNCLYRALTYGPEFTAHGGGRDSTGAYLSGMKQKDNVLAHTVTHEEIKEIQTDGSWRNMATGQLQLKAAAEAMRINIDFIDGDKLERELEKAGSDNVEKDILNILRFDPTPILMEGEAEPVESRFGPDKAVTIFLWREHYYPMFPRGTFPYLRRMPGHHIGAQVASPSHSTYSDTRTSDGVETTIGDVLDKITMHQDNIAEYLENRKSKSTSPPLHSPSTTKGVRPGKEHWDPHHNSLVFYTGKTAPPLEELPPKPVENGAPPVETTGINGWTALGLGAVVATLTAVAGAIGWKRSKRPSKKGRIEKRARNVKYCSDDDGFQVHAEW